MKLADIAHVHSGYPYRASLKNCTSGNTALIQMRDTSPEGIGQIDNFARIQAGRLSPHYWLQPGDLIFRSRTRNNTAVLVMTELTRTTCIAPLMLIRVKQQSQVLPAYLLWLINHPHTQQQIAALACGKANSMITVAAMKGLDVGIPSLADQHKIVAASQLQQQAQCVEIALAAKRRAYYEQVTLQLVQLKALPALA